MMHIKQYKKGVAYILDNGAYIAKMGNSRARSPHLIPNCIMKVKSERRRPFIGDQIEECRDASGLFYILPFQRGYLVNWDIQKTVWDYIFSKDATVGKLSDVPLCITEPIMNFQSVQEAMDEIFFEEYDCCGLLRLNSADLSARFFSNTHSGVENVVIVDSGYSFTHIVPYVNGKKYLPGVRRLDVGGKVLTNHLKEVISYRQLHVMDETYVINQMKEDSCFVSKHFIKDMKMTLHKDRRNHILRDYILPDYSKIKRGYLQSPFPKKGSAKITIEDSNLSANIEQQAIRLNNERITVPEILFNPSDIGIPQKGIAEAVVESIEACPTSVKFQLLSNILLTGGNTKFCNFRNRIFGDVRKCFEESITVNVYTPHDPLIYSWEGGKHLAGTEEFYSFLVSKEEYEEYGSSFSHTRLQKFSIV